MKNTLLFFAILAFSSNAFAQNKRQAQQQQATSNSIENIKSRIEAAGMKTPAVFSNVNLLYAFELQATDPGSSPPNNDSVYNWQWDIIQNGWKRSLKMIDIVYNNNNVTSELGKKSWKHKLGIRHHQIK